MTRRPGFRLALALALLPLSVQAQQAAAPQQEVRGTITEGGTLAPIEGAMVLLLDENGTRIGGVLSAIDGRYRVPVPAPGRYRLRIDRIGYGSTDTDLFDVAAGASVVRSVASNVSAVELAGIEVQGEKRCEARSAQGVSTSAVWEEARKALDAAMWTSDRALYSFNWTLYRRALDENAQRVISEQRTPGRGYSTSPFVASDPAQLAAKGFVERLPTTGEFQYSAPDAKVLLSDAFLDTHCFSTVAEERDGEALIGLTFEPLDPDRVSDIEGTLWLDRKTALLRSIEYTYIKPVPGLTDQKAGGGLTFESLPNGTWIVKDWSIRMPIVEQAKFRGSALEMRVTGYNVIGGIVQRATTNTGAVVMDDRSGGIRGIVTDSLGQPMPSAIVAIQGTAFTTSTDTDGTFSFTGVGTGTWTVVGVPFAFAMAGVEAPGVQVEVAQTGMSTVRLQMPSLSAAIVSACAATPPGPGEAVIAGRVLDGNTKPIPGAQIRLGWQNATQNASTTDLSGPGGAFLFCNIPADKTVTARASLDGRISEETKVTLSGPTAVVTAFLPDSATAPDAGVQVADDTQQPASLRLRVTDAATGEPVDGAQVGFLDLKMFVESNAAGSAILTGIPPGDHVLQVRMPGYGGASAPLRLDPGAAASGSVALTTSPLPIEGITVTVAAALDPRLQRNGFYDRVKSGLGAHLETRDMDKLTVKTLSTVFKRYPVGTCYAFGIGRGNPLGGLPPGAKMAPNGNSPILSGSQSETGVWDIPKVYLDGIVIDNPERVFAGGLTFGRGYMMASNLDQFAAVEVYAKPAGLPPEYSGLGSDCGVVLLWSKQK